MSDTSAAWWRILLISVLATPVLSLELPPLVPAVHDHLVHGDTDSTFHLPQRVHIVVDEQDAHSTKDTGLSLIPPTLVEFAQTFKSDLEALFPRTAVSLSLGDVQKLPSNPAVPAITLSLSDHLNATHADGSPTTEGYEMEVSSRAVRIVGSGSQGAFWATRTLLQGLVLTDGQFPAGKVVDQPDWPTRGFMLGAQRPCWNCFPVATNHSSPAYMQTSVGSGTRSTSSRTSARTRPGTRSASLCVNPCAAVVCSPLTDRTSAQHVHLSDNVSPRGNFNAYARFRLRPEDPALAGLTPHLNETYSRAEFDAFQAACAARGVTVSSSWMSSRALRDLTMRPP